MSKTLKLLIHDLESKSTNPGDYVPERVFISGKLGDCWVRRSGVFAVVTTVHVVTVSYETLVGTLPDCMVSDARTPKYNQYSIKQPTGCTINLIFIVLSRRYKIDCASGWLFY
jgi:hypothetical protein